MDTNKTTADFMKRHSLVLATAESCTGGQIASTLAQIPGAACLLDSAFVAYSTQSKELSLDVDPRTIELHGAVSEEVAREMALGALAKSKANVAVANTGVVDEMGEGVPPGTQCFAWVFRDPVHHDQTLAFTETRRFSGDAQLVRAAAATYALKRIPVYARRALEDTPFNSIPEPSRLRMIDMEAAQRALKAALAPRLVATA